jgi:hypothetical protein
MSTITLDPATVDALRKCADAAVLQDAAGNVIGYFEPPGRLYEPGEIPELDRAELERRELRWQGLPSAEVRRRLEALR